MGPELPVTPLLMGPVCLISQDRFEEPVRIGPIRRNFRRSSVVKTENKSIVVY